VGAVCADWESATMKVGDLVKSTYSNSRGTIVEDLGLAPDAGNGNESQRLRVMLFSTGGMCTFRSYELEVVSEGR